MSSRHPWNSSRVAPAPADPDRTSGSRPPSGPPPGGARPSGPPPRHRGNGFRVRPGAPPPRPLVDSLVNPEVRIEYSRARSSSSTNGTEQRSSSEVHDVSNEEMIELLKSELAASGESERCLHAINTKLGDGLKVARRESMEARRQLVLRDANIRALLGMREGEVARFHAQLEQSRGDLEIANARIDELEGQVREAERQNAALVAENDDLRRDLAESLNVIVDGPNPAAAAGRDNGLPPGYEDGLPSYNEATGQPGVQVANPSTTNRNRSECVIL